MVTLAALVLALLLTGCAAPRYACFPVQTDRGPAMLCSPLKETP